MLRNPLLVAIVFVGAVVNAGFAVADQPMDKDAPAFSIPIEARDAITQQRVTAIRTRSWSGMVGCRISLMASA